LLLRLLQVLIMPGSRSIVSVGADACICTFKLPDNINTAPQARGGATGDNGRVVC
jgi:hypothetical protein